MAMAMAALTRKSLYTFSKNTLAHSRKTKNRIRKRRIRVKSKLGVEVHAGSGLGTTNISSISHKIIITYKELYIS